MAARTDLAIDVKENLDEKSGVLHKEEIIGDVKLTEIIVDNENAEKLIGKPKGKYITIEFPQIFKITDFENLQKAVSIALKSLAPEKYGKVLVVGLGNSEITPDSIGPFTAGRVLATRHISDQFAENIGLKGLKSVSVIIPGVLGKTGIEATELILGTIGRVNPDLVIVIDALATNSVTRLFTTVQFCDTGISPGSGVKNSRKELSPKTLGVPVVAVGVPTVADAEAIAYELTGSENAKSCDMFVTPKEVDLLCHRISEQLSEALNIFLQPKIDKDIILGLV